MQLSPIPIHIGIMGHIDAGKTSVARALSELISTAGLDKHSQSKDRGITIDLGFTFFPLDEFMVTLVDAPGHADLIRSVVSGANIIDMAFVVVDAVKGPQVQTGEHLVILDVMQIPKVFILLNKIDYK
jgi:selenocysteine-specific elongation factor